MNIDINFCLVVGRRIEISIEKKVKKKAFFFSFFYLEKN